LFNVSQAMSKSQKNKIIHPLFVRITHWINAFAAIAMLASGFRIYNASPLYNFTFPADLTLGGWLAGALAWHFAVMWILVINGLAYLIYGIFSGHFIRKIVNIGAMAAYRNVRVQLKYLLLHGTGEYNLIQRILYIAVIWDVVVLFFSGVAMWKPVQFAGLTAFLGGYEQARHIHFFGMVILAIFTFGHVILAFAIKGTLKSMFTGRLTKGQIERLERQATAGRRVER
jgi:thiosulfate reductase cytochrome b subunit